MTKTRFHKPKLGTGEKKFRRVMNEYKRGELKTSHGTIVENPKQAVAIAFSEAKLHQSLSEKRQHKFDPQCKTCIVEHHHEGKHEY